MAQQFASWIDNDSHFERVAPVPFSTVCFRYKGTDDDNLVIEEKVNKTGRTFISHTALNNRMVLRLAIGNLATTWADVEEAWRLIADAAK